MSERIWDYLIKEGMTPEGAAGMMGNLQAESGLKAICLENLCKQRYRERLGKIYTDATYMAFVDDGTINREEFLRPMGYQYGWGLAQWSAPSRKAGLYDLCKRERASIGDEKMQLSYLISELKNSYRSVWKVLTTTSDVQEASDVVLLKFEQPGDCSQAVMDYRCELSRAVYKKYTADPQDLPEKKEPKMTYNEAIDRVISVAEAEKGYLEKASNAYLDDKKKNPGSNNICRYWRDVYPQYQGQAWCAVFVAWCFMKAFGLETAKKMLKHWPFVYCPTLAAMTTNKTPKRGSIILFYRGGTYAHTGIVKAVNGSYITTIEGNTSGSSGIIPNGGGVWEKTYKTTDLSSNTKYFMPDYSLACNEPAPGPKPTEGVYMFSVDTVQYGTTGADALLLQTLLKGKGYVGSDGQPLELDGDVGGKTIHALKSYQTAHGLVADGICGQLTWAEILGV